MAVITISRGIKSGGEQLAIRLSQILGYKTISHEVISDCSRKYNIMEQDLLEELENTPGLWQRLTHEHNRYLIYIKCALVDAVRQDNIIYFGHAGQLLLAGISHVLKLRVEAPIEDRIEKVMSEFHKNYDEAIDYIRQVDEQRRHWVKFLYDEDWHNPSLYDLTVNLQNMSLETVCKLVADVANSPEFATTEKSVRQLNDISLACEVKAAIASDDKIWDQKVTVNADDGVITLRGSAKNGQLRDLIAETASQVKGVKKCNVNISLLSDPLSKGKYGHE